MYTNTLNYLQSKFTVNSIFLAFVSAFLLTACGVRGDLYQTPEPEAVAQPASQTQPIIQQQEKQTPNNSETEQQ